MGDSVSSLYPACRLASRHPQHTTITYDVIRPIGSGSFTAHGWLTGYVNPSAILDFLSYELRAPERSPVTFMCKTRTTVFLEAEGNKDQTIEKYS
ncbi:hypothetical protein ElyMa_001331000 [Elysia marginata]|uniref:PLAT domain-containing protein n=1 Tax=Elysia marginata TaxID=1093978 RepID=A0AAV4INA7_9GAST|nr:hypothetical protein ElyMa_001331000 [Elysia marginata]